MINKRKVAKHFTLDIGEGTFTWARDQASIGAEAAFDGIYIIRTPLPAQALDAAGAVAAYKDLSGVESDFKISKDDLDLRPIWHRLDDRVRAHVLICMLACYLTWHLRQAWAPLTYADEHPPPRANPVAPAHRSASAEAKASGKPPRRPASARLPRPGGPPRHPHPPDHHHRRPPDREDHHPHPGAAGRPSTSWARPSRSPWSRHQQHPPETVNPLQARGFTLLGRRNFGLGAVDLETPAYGRGDRVEVCLVRADYEVMAAHGSLDHARVHDVGGRGACGERADGAGPVVIEGFDVAPG